MSNYLFKLKTFERLKDGWDHGCGVEIALLTINRAYHMCRELDKFRFRDIDVFPSPDGSILITGFEISCELNCEIFVKPHTADEVVFDLTIEDENEVEISYVNNIPIIDKVIDEFVKFWKNT